MATRAARALGMTAALLALLLSSGPAFAGYTHDRRARPSDAELERCIVDMDRTVEARSGAALLEKAPGRTAKNPFDAPERVLLSAPGDGTGDGETVRVDIPPRTRPSRKRLLMGLILVLAIAVGFVLMRETR